MNNRYLSRDNKTALKGLLAIFVLFHHLYQYSGILIGTLIGHVFQSMGYLSVSMFLFLSGYGIMQSYKNIGYSYLNKYPRRRLLTFYVDIVIFTLMYLIFKLITDSSSLKGALILTSFTFGGTIITNGWYLQIALVLYAFFYLIFRFIKNERISIILICFF